MKEHTCIACNKVYASSQSLWNHKQRCKERKLPNSKVRNQPFPNSLQNDNSIIRGQPYPNSSQESAIMKSIRPLLQNRQHDEEEQRLATKEVEIGDVEDMITEVENVMKSKFDSLRQNIMDYMFETHEILEKEILGGNVKWEDLPKEPIESSEPIESIDPIEPEKSIFDHVVSQDKDELMNKLEQLRQVFDVTELENLLQDYFDKWKPSKRKYEKIDDMLQSFVNQLGFPFQKRDFGISTSIPIEMKIIFRRIYENQIRIQKLMDVWKKNDINMLDTLTVRDIITRDQYKALKDDFTPENIKNIL